MFFDPQKGSKKQYKDHLMSDASLMAMFFLYKI